MHTALLPATVKVIVRDWLNANNIVLLQPDHNVVIDTGYVAHAQQTLALLMSSENVGHEPLHLVVNTHCHSDHMGGNALLARTYGCPIAIPEGEAPFVRAWDTRELYLDYAGQRSEPFVIGEELSAGKTYRWGGLDWVAISAPGHDVGALVFYCAEQRVLISGDALWENGFGIVPPDRAGALAAARSTLEMLSRLDVAMVIPGHGPPFGDFDAALERAFKRLEAFEADPLRMARHVLKVLLVFTLLERGRMALAELPAAMEQVPVFSEYNALYFRLTAAELADMLVHELERAGAVARSSGYLLAR